MTGKYYYLIASLPYLGEGEISITKKEFLSECVKWLSPRALAVLKEADTDEDIKCENVPALNDWKVFKTELDEGLLAVRKADATDSPQDSTVPPAVRAVFEEETPLLMEKRLAAVQLDFIDTQLSRYFFDLNWLIMYFLKIQILERLSVFNKDEGEKFFYELCEVEYEK
jgi:hypothetical protein